MHSIKIDNLVEFKYFLSLNLIEYVDLFIKNEACLLISNTNEIFGSLELKSLSSISEKPLSCRIPVIAFKCLEEGTIEIHNLNDISISLVFIDLNGDIIYRTNFTKQNVFSLAYDSKLALLEEVSKGAYSTVDLKDIAGLCKIGKRSNSILTVCNDYACVILADNIRVYQELSTKFNFSINSSGLSNLYKCSSKITGARNYLVAKHGSLSVIASKIRNSDTNEFSIVKSLKSKFNCNIDFTNLRKFLSKVKLKVDYFIIDIKTKCCLINEGRIVYNIPIGIENDILSAGAEFDSFTLPTSVVNDIFLALPNVKFALKVKKLFIELQQGDTIIIFKG